MVTLVKEYVVFNLMYTISCCYNSPESIPGTLFSTLEVSPGTRFSALELGSVRGALDDASYHILEQDIIKQLEHPNWFFKGSRMFYEFPQFPF